MEKMSEKQISVLRRDYSIVLHGLYTQKSMEELAVKYNRPVDAMLKNAHYYKNHIATQVELEKYNKLLTLINIINVSNTSSLSQEEKISKIMQIDFDENKIQDQINAYYSDKIKNLKCDELIKKNKERINVLTIAGAAAGRIISEKKKKAYKEAREANNTPYHYGPSSKKLKDAEEMVNKYVSLGILSSEFFRYSNVNKAKLEQAIRTLKSANSPVYQEYLRTFAEISLSMKELLEDIVSYMNDKENKFDIIDYYLTTSIPLQELWKFERVNHLLNDEKHAIFNQFVSSNKESLISEEYIMNLNVKRNFEGIERYISDEEKESIIKTLKQNNVPINSTTYFLMLKKYAEGNLLLPRVLKK